MFSFKIYTNGGSTCVGPLTSVDAVMLECAALTELGMPCEIRRSDNKKFHYDLKKTLELRKKLEVSMLDSLRR